MDVIYFNNFLIKINITILNWIYNDSIIQSIYIIKTGLNILNSFSNNITLYCRKLINVLIIINIDINYNFKLDSL
jgi:hypothetical protein